MKTNFKKNKLKNLLFLAPLLILIFCFKEAQCGNSSGATLSESDAIGIVKARMNLESRPGVMYRQKYVTKTCSSQMAAYDNRCRPCAPGSPNYCIQETIMEKVNRPARCRFPPTKNAKWSATYNSFAKEWEVKSFDPYATGRNFWYVDDRSRTIKSGYCIYH